MLSWQQRLKGDRTTMARDFLILDMMSDVSKSVAAETVEKISIFDIEFHEENFYRICDIEELMDSIIQEGGVQENIVVRRNPNGSEYKYQLISGHRRVTASLRLVKEGYSEFEFIHARVKNNMNDEDALYELIKANSTQRVRSEYEIVTEYLLLKKLAANKKANNEFKGKTRTFIAEFMGVSEAQVAIYNTIGTRLHSDLMELFAKEEIKISLAYEIAKLADDDQLALVDVYLEKGRLTSEDVKELISKKALPGQITIENVSDSDTFEEPDIEYSVEENEPEADNIEVPDIEFSVEEKVSDSDTFEKGEMVYEQKAEKPRITCDEDEIDSAIKLMFCQWNSPEQILNELVEKFSKQKINPEIGAELIFSKILPYEDDYIRVSYQSGYKIELKLSRECYCIPTYYFWKGFKKVFEWKWKKVSDSDTLEQTAADENVSDSDTFEEPDIEYSVEENEPEADNIEVPDIEFSVEEKVSDSDTSENSNMAAERLYTINDIELEMETYRFRYERAIKSDIALKHIMKQQMLYDALTLLLDSIKKGESR